MNETQLLTFLNEASQDELTVLPGVGPALADRLTAARPIDSLEGAQSVRGISAAFLERLMAAGSEAEPQSQLQPDAESQEAGEDKHADENHLVPEPESLDEAQLTPELLDGEDAQSVLELESAGEASTEEKAPAESYLSDIKENFKDKSQVVSEELAEIGENVSHWGQAARQEGEALAEKLEQLSVKNRRLIWTVLISSMVTALIAIVLTLAVLSGINGGLKYATGSQYATMQQEADQMTSQLALLQQDLDGLRGRVDTFEGLGERMAMLEKAQEQIAADVQAASLQVTDMEDQVIAINEKLTQQEERTRRFDTFLKELQTLLGSLFAPQGEIQ